MKKHSLKAVSAIIALLLLLCIFPACGGNSGGEAQTGQTPAAGADQSPGERPSAPAPSPKPAETGPAKAETGSGFADVSLPLTDKTAEFGYWDRMAPYLMAYNVSYDDFLYYKELEKMTNIHLNFTIAPFFTANEQFNIMIASLEYPDFVNGFFGMYAQGIDNAVSEGITVDLAKYLDTDMPNYKASLDLKPRFKVDSYSDTGKLGAANTLWVETEGVSSGGYIRKDWCDAVGLDIPATYEGYEALFAAFKTKLGKTDFYGLAPPGVDSGQVMAAGYNTAGFYTDEAARYPFLTIDGKVQFGPTNDGFRKYLEMMTRWYKEGYINRDYMNWASSGIPLDQQVAGVIGFMSTERDRMQTIMEQSEEPGIELAGVPNPVQKEGDVCHYRNAEYVVSAGTAITTGCDNLELALRYIDFMYSDAGTLLANYGVKGETYELDKDGSPYLTDLVVKSDTYNLTVAAVVYTKFGGPMRSYDSRLLKHFKPYILEANEEWLKTDEAYIFPLNASMAAADISEYSNIMLQIKTYCTEMTNRFITGDLALTDDAWNEYVNTVKSLKLDRATQLKQKSYDAYMARMKSVS